MATKKSTSKLFSALLIMMFLVMDVQPARAESLASSHFSSSGFGWAKGMGGAGTTMTKAEASSWIQAATFIPPGTLPSPPTLTLARVQPT
jgi:hypothetical protein